MADSCSNLKRSRTELLASMSSSDLQWQVGFGVEATHFRRRLVIVHDAEVGLLEIGDVLTVLVGHGEHHVDLVGKCAERCDRVNGIVGGLCSLVGRRR